MMPFRMSASRLLFTLSCVYLILTPSSVRAAEEETESPKNTDVKNSDKASEEETESPKHRVVKMSAGEHHEAHVHNLKKMIHQDEYHGKCPDTDVFFALDSSASVGSEDFKQMKTFTANLIKKIDNGRTRVGVVRFSDNAKMIFLLNRFGSDLKKAVDRTLKIEYKPGKTAIGEALELIRTIGFRKKWGHRAHANKVVVLITDGSPNGPDSAYETADKLRKKDATILGVGIGKSVNEQALVKMAGNKRDVVIAKTYSALVSLSNTMHAMICGSTLSEHNHGDHKGKKHERHITGVVNQKLLKKMCKKHCSSDYELTRTCKCRLVSHNLRCMHHHKKDACGNGYSYNSHCKCVRKEKKAHHACKKVCKGRHMVLNRKKCRCECNRRCYGKKSLDESTCTCQCNIRCVSKHFWLDERRCRCRPVKCSLGEKSVEGKCETAIKYKCPKDHLFIRHVCLKTKDCPPGFKENKLRECKKHCCRGPCSRDQSDCLPASCGHNKFIINGHCKRIVQRDCGPRAFFNLLKPRCPKTCTEPVQMSSCKKKWRGPGCSCYPGFLLHKDKCVHPSQCPNKPMCLKYVDVLIMLDSSASIGNKNFFLMKRFSSDLVQQMHVEGGHCDRLAVMRFNHNVNMMIHFKDFKKRTHGSMIKIIDQEPYEPGLTYLGEALNYARTKVWNKKDGMRKNVPRIMFLLTDGTNTNGELDQYYEAKKLREMGVQIIILKVGGQNPVHKSRIYHLAGETGRVFVFGLRHFEQISELLQRVVSFSCNSHICPSPRLIPGKCIHQFRFYHKLEFVKTRFKCKSHMVKNAIKRRCRCPKSVIKEGDCIKGYQDIKRVHYRFYRKKELCRAFAKTEHVRCSCPKDEREIGECHEQFQTLKEVRYTLENSFSKGKYCKKSEVSKSLRCGCPPPRHKPSRCVGHFRVVYTTYHVFDKKTRKCHERSKQSEVRCSCPGPKVFTKPCVNQRIEVKIDLPRMGPHHKCIVDTYYGQEHCRRICDTKNDVAFIVDTSKSMNDAQFTLIKTFIKEVVKNLNISPLRDRVSIMTFSSPEHIYLINDYFTFTHKQPLLDRIDEIQFFKGSTDTGLALESFRLRGLQRDHGSRLGDKNVNSILYLITDGMANGNINPIEESQKIRAMGVIMAVVAIGDSVSEKQIKKIASKPLHRNVFRVKRFKNLKKLVHTVGEDRCSMEGGVNYVNVKYRYERLLHDELIRRNTTNLRELTGLPFQHFRKLHMSDYCRVAFQVDEYWTVIGGMHKKEREEFKDDFKNKVAKVTGVHPYEVRNFQISGGMKKRVTKANFDIPCRGGNVFAKLMAHDEFKYRQANKKNMVFASWNLIGASTRRLVRETQNIEGYSSRVFQIVRGSVVHSKILGKLFKERKEISIRVRKMHNILYSHEEKTLRLAMAINKANLKNTAECSKVLQTHVKRKKKLAMLNKRIDMIVRKMEKALKRVVIYTKMAKLHIRLITALKSGSGKASSGATTKSAASTAKKASGATTSAAGSTKAASAGSAAAGSTKAASAGSTAAGAAGTTTVAAAATTTKAK